MSGWSETTVQRLFNDPRFPAIDYGKRKLVENHALMKDIIKQVALKNGVSEEEVRKEMQKTIHEAYLQKSPTFINMFGDKEPSVEEFLKIVAVNVKGVS